MKKVLVTIIIVILASLIFIAYKNNKKQTNDNKIEEEKIINVIENYNYKLADNKNSLYKEKFNELKKVLEKDQVDYKEYANLIAQLFTIDFYDLNSKKTNTDIGGLEFIHPTIKEEFSKSASDSLYKYIENNIYGDRKQELPEVKKILVEENLETNYKGEKIQDENAYIVTLSIEYAKNLDYPNKVTLTITHKDNKLYIIEVK